MLFIDYLLIFIATEKFTEPSLKSTLTVYTVSLIKTWTVYIMFP